MPFSCSVSQVMNHGTGTPNPCKKYLVRVEAMRMLLIPSYIHLNRHLIPLLVCHVVPLRSLRSTPHLDRNNCSETSNSRSNATKHANDPAERAMNTIARLHIPLDAHEYNCSPEDDFKTVENHVGFQTEPFVVLLREDLVCDDDERFSCNTENHHSCSSWWWICDNKSVDDSDTDDTKYQEDLDNVDWGHEGRHLEGLRKIELDA